jgi:hypothetical protein
MSLNESILEDTALERFRLCPALRDFGAQAGDQPSPSLPPSPAFRRAGRRSAFTMASLAPGELASRGRGRDSFTEVVLVGRLREAIRLLNPAVPFLTLATLRGTLLPNLLSGEITVAALNRLQ